VTASVIDDRIRPRAKLARSAIPLRDFFRTIAGARFSRNAIVRQSRLWRSDLMMCTGLGARLESCEVLAGIATVQLIPNETGVAAAAAEEPYRYGA
jgi:hypothetical protein